MFLTNFQSILVNKYEPRLTGNSLFFHQEGGGEGGGIAQMVSRLPLKLGTQVRIPVRAKLGSPNACMGREEITSFKVFLTNFQPILVNKYEPRLTGNSLFF